MREREETKLGTIINFYSHGMSRVDLVTTTTKELSKLLHPMQYEKVDVQDNALRLASIAGMRIGLETTEVADFMSNVFEVDNKQPVHDVASFSGEALTERLIDKSNNDPETFFAVTRDAVRSNLNENTRERAIFFFLAIAGMSVIPLRDDQSKKVVIKLQQDLFPFNQ